MPVIQAIPRLPIDSVPPTDSRSMRTDDAFQAHFDQKLDSAKSKSDNPINESSKTNSDRPTQKNAASSELQVEKSDSTEETDQIHQSETDELKDSTTDEKSDDDNLTLKDESVESQKKNRTEEQTEIQNAMLLEAAQLATVANPEAKSLGETSEQAGTIDQVHDQPLKIEQPAQAVSFNRSENSKPIDSTKPVEKSDGQIDVSEFQPVESSEKSDTDDSKHESRDSRSFDESLAKQQAKLDGETVKPNIDQPKPEQTDPTRLTIDPIQSKSNDSTVKAISTPHVPHHDPEVARSNVENIVSSVRAQLLPRGGSMQMRLDPPELGALTISLKLIDGRMTASFTTENADATRMLSNNLGQLKSTLEASGVQVHRLDVKMSTESFSNTREDESGRNQQKQSEGSWQQSEQQRREMVNRMWRRYAYGSDELDLVA